jgi:hypothetical protein
LTRVSTAFENRLANASRLTSAVLGVAEAPPSPVGPVLLLPPPDVEEQAVAKKATARKQNGLIMVYSCVLLSRHKGW